MLRLVLFFLASVFAAKAALPPLPQPATSFGAAMHDGALYIYGGNQGKAHEFHRESIRGEFFRLRLTAGSEWEALGSETPLLGSALVAHGGHLYRIGGLMARNAKGEPNDLHSSDLVARFDPAQKRWETLAPLPENRSSHDAAVLDGILYVGGGWNLQGRGARSGDTEGDWHKTMLTLDLAAPEKGWQSHPQPFERRALAVVAHAGRVWFLGGMDSLDDPSLAVDWFDPKTKEWGKGPELPGGSMAGFGMAACSADGKLLASPLSGNIYALSADGSKWETVTKLERPRFFHRLLPAGPGRLVVVGGSSRKHQIREPEFVSLQPAASEKGEKDSAAASPDASGAVTISTTATEENSRASWPQWRGANRDGISPESGWRKEWEGAAPAELWRAQIGTGMSSPVVAQGRVIAHGNDGRDSDVIAALDAATGKELWRHAFPCRTAPHEMPIVPAGPGATPTIAADRVFALSREGDLLCLDLKSGAKVWGKNIVRDLGGKRPVYGYTQSPLVEDGRIFIDAGAAPGEKGSTLALDAATGEVIWRAGTGEAGYSAARVMERDGKRLVVMFKGEALDVFDPRDGSVLWSHRLTARDFSNAVTPAFLGHRVLVSNTSTEPAALLEWEASADPNPRPRWSHKQFALLFNSPILHDGCFFGFNEKRRGHHEFTCIDAESGETRWVSDAVPTSTFLLSDGHWIFLTREGEVVIAPASAKELKPLSRFQAVPGKCYATPVLAGGRLFVRSNTGELACFDLRETSAQSAAGSD